MPTTGWGIVVLRYVDAFESWRNKQARIAPEAGANLFSFTFGGQELLLQPAALADLMQQRSGMPVLFPTPNRVRDAQMAFEGRQFRFEANNQNNFIHGLVRRRPWKVVGSPGGRRRSRRRRRWRWTGTRASPTSSAFRSSTG